VGSPRGLGLNISARLRNPAAERALSYKNINMQFSLTNNVIRATIYLGLYIKSGNLYE